MADMRLTQAAVR